MKYSIFIATLIFHLTGLAQDQDSLSINDNLFWSNQNYYNPALTGINGNTIGFSSSFHKVQDRSFATQFYNAEISSKNNKHSFGFQSRQHTSTYQSDVDYTASYARNLKLNNGNQLSLGLNAKYESTEFRIPGISEEDYTRNTLISSSFGAAYKTKNTRLGLSIDLPAYSLLNSEVQKNTEKIRFFVGHNFKLHKNFNLVTQGSIYLGKNSYGNTILGFDELKVDLIYKKKFFLRFGGSFMDHSNALEIGYMINDKLKISYSTNILTSANSSRNHFIGLSLRF